MKAIHILLVEDNEGDILLTTEAFEERKVISKLSVIKNGQEAIDFLSKTGKHTDAVLPDLILLDINLPLRNGHEVLKYIKGTENLKQIPVIMLTTSSFEKDISYSYKNFANCYIVKPLEADDFLNAVERMEDFWFHVVQLPNT
ncbi:MAG: response regulator [Ferruginibacter sp.]